jgi:hypothetical protein
MNKEFKHYCNVLATARELDQCCPPEIIDNSFSRIPERVRIKIEMAKNAGRKSAVIIAGHQNWNTLIINTLNKFNYNAYRAVLILNYDTHKECKDVIKIEWD